MASLDETSDSSIAVAPVSVKTSPLVLSLLIISITGTVWGVLTFVIWVVNYDAIYHPAEEVGKKGNFPPDFFQYGWFIAAGLTFFVAVAVGCIWQLLLKINKEFRVTTWPRVLFLVVFGLALGVTVPTFIISYIGAVIPFGIAVAASCLLFATAATKRVETNQESNYTLFTRKQKDV